MDVILHLGAHRTASTSFQTYLARNPMQDVAVWGPKITRGGMLDGVQGSPLGMRPALRAKGRLAVQFAALEARGTQALMVSDPNLIGSMRANLRSAALYPDIGPRLARLYAAFGGRISRVLIQIRALDSYWASVLAFGVSRGIVAPDAQLCARIASSQRGWRDVITELACAYPDVQVLVSTFEQCAQRPDRLAETALGMAVPPVPPNGIWANRQASDPLLRRCVQEFEMPDHSKLFDADGHWRPFTPDQRHRMRIHTSQDLAWLRAGAEGLAAFHDRLPAEHAVRARPLRRTQRGSEDNDSQDRHMAQPG